MSQVCQQSEKAQSKIEMRYEIKKGLLWLYRTTRAVVEVRVHGQNTQDCFTAIHIIKIKDSDANYACIVQD